MVHDFIEKPAILLSGGSLMNADKMVGILAPFIGDATWNRVAYIGCANSDKKSSFDSACSLFRFFGATNVDFVKLAQETIDEASTKLVISRADVIFLSGGDPEVGMRWIQKHNLTGFLKELYNDGMQFVATSAGAIMMGTSWVYWDYPDYEGPPSLMDCLGMIPCVFDTHGEEDNWIEMKTMLQLMGAGSIGYGLAKGCIVSADSSGYLENLNNKLITFTYG
ncbi:MAG: Type 1 glutamine amidotransferase-like domain-containing protein [Eubacteriaceae bacterium]|nr:Type 1 glutamine amidotransferase-like domain-containing protein [Eubacteriaceae bacterium]